MLGTFCSAKQDVSSQNRGNKFWANNQAFFRLSPSVRPQRGFCEIFDFTFVVCLSQALDSTAVPLYRKAFDFLNFHETLEQFALQSNKKSRHQKPL